MRKAILLAAILLAAPALAGCTSLEDYLDKRGVVKVYISSADGELDRFQSVNLLVVGFVVKDPTPQALAPQYKNISARVDLANINGAFLVHEMKLPVGQYNISSITIQVTSAVLKNGTAVTVAVRDTHGPGVYSPRAAGGLNDLASFPVDRAKESHVEVAFTVKHDTRPVHGPGGSYYLDWDDEASGPFTP